MEVKEPSTRRRRRERENEGCCRSGATVTREAGPKAKVPKRVSEHSRAPTRLRAQTEKVTIVVAVAVVVALCGNIKTYSRRRREQKARVETPTSVEKNRGAISYQGMVCALRPPPRLRDLGGMRAQGWRRQPGQWAGQKNPPGAAAAQRAAGDNMSRTFVSSRCAHRTLAHK
jgi:hypothetical protein